MSAGQAWDRVVRAALLGTERQAEIDAATGDAALDGAIAALADRPAEARLLGTAALLDAWRRAGRRASTAPAPPEPAPRAEEARAPSPLAARALRQVLAGSTPALVAEWMALARNAGVGIPHELLPDVLELGRRKTELRAEVAAALGPRGRWLASLNPDWSYAVALPGEPATAWETGTAEERARILRAVRGADPAAGLALVQSTWSADPAKDRAAFVEALATGLSMDDEPFLESALDDRSKQVREAAAGLLPLLPESRLVRRMTDRLAPLLTFREPEGMLARLRGSAPKLEVTLPAECDAAMRRDGVDPKPGYGFGERAWWLHQMIVAVPPAYWTARWGRPAADLLAAARAGEGGQRVVDAWTEAAIRHRDAAWAEARLRITAREERLGMVDRLAAVLPPERLEPLVLERIPGEPVKATLTGWLMLSTAHFPWSPALTRAVLSAVPVPLPPSAYDARELLRTAVPRVHPATAVAVLREQGDPHQGTWVDQVHLRATLHQAFE
ncbi:DUF5691 domain-containing protein [Longimicrobium sp.]|uniref:DUF5691 domain-containing protein n=1 Tax=Longimicrobium sp. TaxID=2029185 RepID=UPI002E2F0ED7|nr:DUF5691 domain-containing protein [Longimicrobium sp.]HEX6040801.1 DUF5691 domain-containing protein [Longimicrobium sp.]